MKFYQVQKVEIFKYISKKYLAHFIILQIFTSSFAQAFDLLQGNKLEGLILLGQKIQESNSYNLEIKEFKYSRNDGQILISSNQEGNIIYAADRALNSLDKLEWFHNTLKKNGSYNLPIFFMAKKKAKTYILDLHLDNNEKLFASIFYYADDSSSPPILKIFEFSPKSGFIEIFSYTSSFNIPPSNFYQISGKLSSNNKNIFLATGTSFNENYSSNDLINAKKDLKIYEESVKNNKNIFGTIISISKKNYSSHVMSFGHRSPDGLYWNKNDNLLYESEHGPRGGDELNIIKKGHSYGWPYETFGEPYKQNSTYPVRYNSHNNYTQPIYAWVPSPGISEISSIDKGSSFSDKWLKNIIIGSLKDKSLYRLKLNDNKHIIFSERIFIGSRIRSFDITDNFMIAGTDNGSIIIIKNHSIPEGDYLKSDYKWPRCAYSAEFRECKI